MVAEFNELGDLVIWVNVTRHTASFLLGYVVVVAKESLKLLVLVRFQVSQPIYYITTAEIVIPKSKSCYCMSRRYRELITISREAKNIG